MSRYDIKLYEALKERLCAEETKALLDHVNSTVEEHIERIKETLFTKEDYHELNLKIERLYTLIAESRSELFTMVAENKAEGRKEKYDLLKWLIILIVGQSGVYLTLSKLL